MTRIAGKYKSMTLVALATVAYAQTTGAQPKAFASPGDAAKALIEATAANNTHELVVILGSAGQSVLTSGDPRQDVQERQEFSKLASRKNHIERSSMSAKMAVLVVGDDDWPFPIPLVRTGQQWHFDAESGATEMRARRIGADELDVIEICKGYVSAQQAYAEQRKSGAGALAYAQKIKQDGFAVTEGLALADAGSPDRKPYHGYYFRILKEQGPNARGGAHKYVVSGSMIGGFGLIAWPAEYGVTGIHAFMVNQDGEVYEKDFGARTATLAPAVTRYDPDPTWAVVD